MTDVKKTKKLTEETFKVKGKEILKKVKELIREGNIRKIIIKNKNGKTILEIPLTIGIVGAALAPALALLGTATALLTECTIIAVKEKTK